MIRSIRFLGAALGTVIGLTLAYSVEGGMFAGQQFSAFKNALADLTVEKLAPINSEMRRLVADPAEIDRVLKDGAHKARLAQRTSRTSRTRGCFFQVTRSLEENASMKTCSPYGAEDVG